MTSGSDGRRVLAEPRGPSGTGPEDDAALVAALRRGDEAAFLMLVDRHAATMLRVAQGHVRDRRAAEDVVQETWLAVLEGLDGFEGRSSLKTWIFRILVNRAISRAEKERRQLPFSSLGGEGDDGPTVEPERFLGADHHWAGHWSVPPASWAQLPEARLLSREALERLREAAAALPPRQLEVLVLRDMAGLDAAEVCALLDLSEGNQRVLLHRARARLRTELEEYFAA